ncbi:hypothetical protein GE09DRAFT_652139 [Coniochaeta sp. 2T2.1]|nr:hypothetical protein GE09DRAFT_652139 [Coniochaeta sp. 2T2.1]
MKGLGALALTAGLVSAVTINPNVQTSVQAAPAVNEASGNAQAESITNIFNSSVNLNGSQISASDPNFDPASLNLNNLGGVNLGQIDFSDQNSVASGILSMLNVLCAGNLFDTNSILNLGQNSDLELFLELVQLMQLEQLGFLNVFDVQSLLGSGFGAGFGSQFGGNSNIFNLGFFKRAVSERKKTMKRTRLRRSPTKTRTKRQCQAGAVDPNAVANLAPSVVAPEASATPPAATEPAAAAPEAAPAAAEPAAAAPAAAPSDDGESLSDFTR